MGERRLPACAGGQVSIVHPAPPDRERRHAHQCAVRLRVLHFAAELFTCISSDSHGASTVFEAWEERACASSSSWVTFSVSTVGAPDLRWPAWRQTPMSLPLVARHPIPPRTLLRRSCLQQDPIDTLPSPLMFHGISNVSPDSPYV